MPGFLSRGRSQSLLTFQTSDFLGPMRVSFLPHRAHFLPGGT